MNKAYRNIQWVIQRNLTNTGDLQALKQGCENIGVSYIEFDIIPFTDQLPGFDKSKQSIFYGSTTMGQLVYRDNSINKIYYIVDFRFSFNF